MYIDIAGCIIEFHFPSIQLRIKNKSFTDYVGRFRTKKKKSDFTLIFRKKKQESKIKGNTILIHDSISFYTFTWTIRLLLRKYLAQHNGFYIHCAANRISKNQAIVFLGNSGAGKSTVSDMLDLKYPKIVDDVAIIRKVHTKWYLFQTPVQEKNKVPKSSKKYKIEALFFLRKRKKIELFTGMKENYLRRVCRQTWIEKKYVPVQFQLITDLVNSIPVKKLSFTKKSTEMRGYFKKWIIPDFLCG